MGLRMEGSLPPKTCICRQRRSQLMLQHSRAGQLRLAGQGQLPAPVQDQPADSPHVQSRNRLCVVAMQRSVGPSRSPGIACLLTRIPGNAQRAPIRLLRTCRSATLLQIEIASFVCSSTQLTCNYWALYTLLLGSTDAFTRLHPWPEHLP